MKYELIILLEKQWQIFLQWYLSLISYIMISYITHIIKMQLLNSFEQIKTTYLYENCLYNFNLFTKSILWWQILLLNKLKGIKNDRYFLRFLVELLDKLIVQREKESLIIRNSLEIFILTILKWRVK